MQAEAQAPRLTDINEQISRIALYILLITLAIAVLFPFYWMVMTSLNTNQETFIYPPEFYPPKPTPEHYHEIMTRGDINVPRWGWNSLFIAVATTILTLFVTSLAAYGFARLDFPYKNLIFIVVIFTLMIPSQIYMIPNYLLVRDLGWLDSYHALIWPAAPNVFGLFLLRQFFSTFPRELEEAANCRRREPPAHLLADFDSSQSQLAHRPGHLCLLALLERSVLATSRAQPGGKPDAAGWLGGASRDLHRGRGRFIRRASDCHGGQFYVEHSGAHRLRYIPASDHTELHAHRNGRTLNTVQ